MTKSSSLVIMTSIALLLGSGPVLEQTTRAESSPQQNTPIRVDVGLTQIVATVTDRQGRYITNLRPEDFIVEVNGVEQRIAHFTLGSETPVSIGILVDTSGSMKERLPAAKQAAGAFIKGMRPQDEFFLMTFGARTKVQQDFTDDRAKLERALDRDLGTGVSTRLFSAVENAAKKLKSGKHKKRALIVISDGGDVSHGSLDKFQKKLSASEVLMYPIETQNADGNWFARLVEPPAAKRTKNMHAIAEETGGQWFGIDASLSPDRLRPRFDEAFAVVSAELRGQYLIGFYPPQPPSKNATPKIRVRAINPEYTVRNRKDATP